MKRHNGRRAKVASVWNRRLKKTRLERSRETEETGGGSPRRRTQGRQQGYPDRLHDYPDEQRTDAPDAPEDEA